MAIGFVLRERLPVAADRIAGKMERIWVVAEIFLFVLVGASVNVGAIGDSWLMGLLVILLDSYLEAQEFWRPLSVRNWISAKDSSA